MLGWFLFPTPPSMLTTIVTAALSLAKSQTGIVEITGKKHMEYSKFRDSSSSAAVDVDVAQRKMSTATRFPGRKGMFLFYAPSLIASVFSFATLDMSAEGSRGLMVRSALAIHFLKRVLEVLFVHKYSGDMAFNVVFQVSYSYLIGTVSTIYAQILTSGSKEPLFDLRYAGLVLFLIGIAGNFYHHHILSRLRTKKDDNGYKIPRGGLFGLVICPHYLFEIIIFVGFAFISQTLYSVFFALSTVFYLTGRSFATKRWYASKFEDFPKDIKVLVPYVL